MCCLPCCPQRCGSQERHCVASQHRQTHQNWRPLEDVFHPPQCQRKLRLERHRRRPLLCRVVRGWGGTRRRVSAGVTAAQALEVQRRKHHELEGRKLGLPGFETAGETLKKPALHVAIAKYLEQIDALKKPNTHRKYEAVLNRFGEFFRDCISIDAISGDDLTRFVVTLKKDHGLGPIRSCTTR